LTGRKYGGVRGGEERGKGVLDNNHVGCVKIARTEEGIEIADILKIVEKMVYEFKVGLK